MSPRPEGFLDLDKILSLPSCRNVNSIIIMLVTFLLIQHIQQSLEMLEILKILLHCIVYPVFTFLMNHVNIDM